MSRDDTHPYKTVRGLTRGLMLLNSLNRKGGIADIAQLAQQTGLHRTTVRRLLETLQDEGYVRRNESDDSYRLTIKVRELSEGFRDEQWVSAVATPLLASLLQEVVWPTDLSSFDGDAMIIRESTHRFSPLSFHRAMVGRRLPMLLTASGLTYLAFCPDAEREQILALLSTRDDEEGRLTRDPDALNALLQKIRYQGYGENFMRWKQEEKIAAIAVPVYVKDQLVGCLSLIYLAKAMGTEQAAQRFYLALRRTADAISDAATRTH